MGAVTVASARPSKLSGRDGVPPSAFAFDDESERHQDGGPATFLQRSASGRLPPAYKSWDEESNDMSSVASHSQFHFQSGAASGGGAIPSGASSAAGSLEPVPPPPPPPEQRQYPRDVKRPIPS